jgi:hypothetical protein
VLVVGTAEVIPDDALALQVIEAILASDPLGRWHGSHGP